MKIRRLFFCTISAFICFFSACSDDMLPSPSTGNPRSAISAPANVTATQGGKQSITLDWDEVSKAARYYIYAADSLFENYEQVGESSKNSFSYEPLEPGKTIYLKVCAVDDAGEESSLTDPVVGTTLAQPIISDIREVSGQEDSAATVCWYMENEKYYRNDLRYTISCKNSDGKEVSNVSVDASELKGETAWKIDELSPSEHYKYSVQAALISNPTAIEVSDEVDAATARRLRPNPVDELTATEGTSTENVTLSFKLPAKVDVLVSSVYTQYPLYFKIYRRVSGTEDWSLLVSHLYFDGKTEKDADLDFANYKEGEEVSWSDTSVQRGIQYEYKVQSYADDLSRIVTSDLSVATVTGWTASVPSFDVTKVDYEKSEVEEGSEETQVYTSASVSFMANWETFGTDDAWKFVLVTAFSEELDGTPVTTEKEIDTLEELNSNPTSVDLTESANCGYYVFSLKIVNVSDSTELLSVTAPTTLFLTSVIDRPDLTSFEKSDGYTSQTELSWTYEDECEYSLQRKTIGADGNAVSDSTKTIEIEGNDASAGEKFSYTDSDGITSGEVYSYTLFATKNGQKFPSQALTAKTLGTPSPKFTENALAYDAITVSWTEVQMAESYEVALYDGESELERYDADSEKIETDTVGGVITYKIKNPNGYDDAAVSGKTLSLKVTAKSGVDEADGTENVRTMGPASLELSASKATDPSQITVTWKEVSGAAGYILQRVRYDIPEEGEGEAQKTDLFYISADKSISYGETAISDTNIMTIETADGTVTVRDKQVELSSTNGYETSQALISSGVPFEYTILPVLSSDDSSEVNSFKIAYENIDKITQQGSTHGFGHNVTATKAEFTNKIEISWNKPAHADGLKPTLYKRKIAASDSDSDSSVWEKVGKVFAADDTSYTDGLSVSEANIYEYAVKYGTNEKTGFSKAYLNLLASRKTPLNESQNRGYAFNVKYTASTGNEAEFAEQLNWIPFDSSKRKAARATGYSIYVKNTNYANGWQKIATLDSTGKRNSELTSGDYDYNVTYDYSEKMPNELTIKPKTATAKYGDVTGGGSYDGILKVLRDPRHYYRIVMEGERTEDGTTYEKITFDPSSEDIADDMSIYACRQITDAELARAAMLTLTYAFYINDGGSTTKYDTKQFEYGGEGTLSTENGGKAVFMARSRATYELGAGKYKQEFSLTKYAPSQLMPSNINKTFLAISMSESSWGIKGDADNYIYTFQGRKTGTENVKVLGATIGTKDVYDSTGIITTASVDSTIPVDYSASISFSCPDKNTLKLTVTRNSKTTTICDTTDTDVRRYYFPMQIHSATKYELGTVSYGWWEEKQ